MNLPFATLIGYSSKGDFFGEDLARWRTVQTVTIEGVMDPDEIANMVSNGSDLPTSANTYLGQSVSVNGVSVNNSRLISLEFPAGGGGSITEIHNDKAKYVAVYEVYIEPTNNIFFGLSFNDLKSLEEFSEEISFELSEDNSYSIVWNMNVKYASGTGGGANSTVGTSESSDGIAAAIALRNALLNSSPASIPTGLQGNGINLWTLQDSSGAFIHWYHTEVYDKQSFTCNFTSTAKVLSNNDAADYTAKIKHTLNYDDDGYISVVEDVEVVGLSDSGTYTSVSARMDAAKAGLDYLLTGSGTRCTDVYNAYKAQLGWNSGSLASHYLNKSVTYDEQSGKASYSITTTDKTNFYTSIADQGYSFISKISKDTSTSDSGEVRTYTEEGEIVSLYRELINDLDWNSGIITRSKDWMYNVLIEKMSQSAENITDAVNLFSEDNFNSTLDPKNTRLISTKITYKPYGKRASYVRKYSTDLKLSYSSSIDYDSYITTLSKSIDTSAGVTKKEWFNPPNNPVGGEFYHVGAEIVEPSTRKVTFKGTLLRNISQADDPLTEYTFDGVKYNSFNYLNIAKQEIQRLAWDMKISALDVYTEYFFPVDTFYQNKFYFPSFNWTFNSDYEFSATLEMKYVVPLGPLPTYPDFHSDTTQIVV
tara:strand:- start:47874 stop:49820 length:1947 start_codon:yes stop_codon:yes gene_type:complete